MNEKNKENLTDADFKTLLPDDLQKIFLKHNTKSIQLKIHEKDLHLALEELHSLTGLASIKQDVLEMVKLVRFYSESGKDITGRFSMHAVFLGNPGTGKTTVARMVAKIYKALGLLERGHCVETDREGLVAGYVGQTAIKTSEMIDKAMGGVLFIDEAYTLGGSQSSGDFGKEAVEIILKRMEDNRGKFAVILAGYTGEMNQFLKINPGLSSRFDKLYHFPDYSPEEMLEIARSILKKEDLYFSPQAENEFRQLLQNAWSQRDKYFGNARFVRQLCEGIIRKQHLRMAEIPAEHRTKEAMKTILCSDLPQPDMLFGFTKNQTTIGFRLNG